MGKLTVEQMATNQRLFNAWKSSPEVQSVIADIKAFASDESLSASDPDAMNAVFLRFAGTQMPPLEGTITG